MLLLNASSLVADDTIILENDEKTSKMNGLLKNVNGLLMLLHNKLRVRREN